MGPTLGLPKPSSMKLRLNLALVGLLAASVPASTLYAADRVVVLAEGPLAVRLQAELATLGIDTVFKDRPASSDPTVLERLAEDNDAIATILLERQPGGMDIWIADRTTEKMVLRRIPVEGGVGSEATAVTKSVELLRASLLEVRIAPSPTRPPDVVERILGPALAAPEAPTLTLRLSPSVLFGGSGFPPSAHLAADVGLQAGAYTTLGATIVPPTFPASLSVLEGDLSLSQGLGMFVSEVHPFPDSRWFDPRVSLGLGVHVAYAEAEGSAQRENGEDLGATAVTNLSLGLSLWATEQFAIDTEFGCGLTLPKTDYVVDGRTAASIGSPLCSGSLGAGFKL
jgi:hypothetical protein